MSTWAARAVSLVETLEHDGDASGFPSERREQLIELLHGLAADAELSELMLETKLEELAAVREMLATISYPVIEVSRDVLCLPIVGPIDAEMMGQVADTLLSTASSRRARWAIIDLTGALLADVAAANLLRGLFGALRLIGVRGALTGISPALAVLLADMPEPLAVPVYSSLALALTASEPTRKAGR